MYHGQTNKMKRILLLVILLFVILIQSHAQEKNITIALGDDEFFVDRIHLGEAGFILKTTHRLLLYSATCDSDLGKEHKRKLFLWRKCHGCITRWRRSYITSARKRITSLKNLNTSHKLKKTVS